MGVVEDDCNVEGLMNQRLLGSTGQAISEISFGCGSVGGLMIRGEHQEQVRAVERAIELGITYFDTAAAYGDGVSEENLGRVLHEFGANVLVGTKLRLGPADLAAGHDRVQSLFDASLSRLDRDHVDILYYHGRIRREGLADGEARGGLTPSEVLGPLLDSFRAFREASRVRFLGFTGLGDTDAVLEVIRAAAFDVLHCYFSAVNPSAGYPVPPTFPPQNMDCMIDRAAAVGMGALAIRILAAGALAGGPDRHPLAGGTGGVLVAGADYESDVQRADRLRPLSEELGISLPELAIRFALAKRELATVLVGVSAIEQVEFAARAAAAGPLPPGVVERIVRQVTSGGQ